MSSLSSLKSRVLVSVIGVPLLLWVVLWAPTVIVAAALGILAGIAAFELMGCVGAHKDFLWIWTVVCAFWSVIWCSSYAEYLPIPWGIYIMLAFLFAVIRGGEVGFLQIAAGIFAVVVVPYSFASFLRLEDTGVHRAYLLLPFIFSFASDTFAYFVGCSIGKHKLAPKVSPKKSVEGAVGGLIGNVAGGLAFAYVMNCWLGQSISYGGIALLGLFCSVVAQLGDLSFSLIKREFGIKDYGKLFLAHGGVLDRFDSVLFVAPVLELLLKYLL